MDDKLDTVEKITYVFREGGGGHSIEQQFTVIANEAEKHCSVRRYRVGPYINIFKDIRSIWQDKPSVVHVTGACHYIILGLIALKSVLTIHDIGYYLYTLRGWRRLVYRIFWFDIPLRLCSRVTTISTYTKSQIVGYFKIPEQTISVVPDCYDPLFTYQPKPFNRDCPRLLQVGAARHKNIQRLADALEGLNCRLMIVGKLDAATRERLQMRNIPFENVWDISREELFTEYVAADLVTFVSLFEGFGVPIIEANAVGRPVVTSNVTAMPEVAGDAACLVDPYSVQAIRAGILMVIQDKTNREMLIENGLSNAKRFTVEAVTKDYFEIYNEIK